MTTSDEAERAGHIPMDIREGETPERYWQRHAFECRVATLLVDALAAGFKVTIHNEPLFPRAMRNDAPIIDVYESRK
jgi:hypothetical protein